MPSTALLGKHSTWRALKMSQQSVGRTIAEKSNS